MSQDTQIQGSPDKSEPIRPLCALDALSNAFGTQDVTPQTRQNNIRSLFQSIASRYDLMNDLMSGGMHRLWKRRFVSRVSAKSEGAAL